MLLQIRFLLIVSLLTFQKVYSDEEDPVKKPRAGVLILDKLNFDEEIKEGVVLVHFYSPTNPSCKAVAPILEELAPKVASDGIKIGKVDCRAADDFNRQLCVDNRVSNRNVFTGHSSEKRGLCLMKSSSKMLQNLPYIIYMKTQSYFFH